MIVALYSVDIKRDYNGCQKSWNEQHNFSIFVLCLPLLPYNVDLSRDMGQSLGTGIRFVIPNVLSSKSNIVPGGGSYRFYLLGDLLRRPLKG